jgi:hypothetical protein
MNNNISKLKLTLSTLSDGELSSICKSFTSNLDVNLIKDQLISKSDFFEFEFNKKDLSNSLINELTNRLLSKNIDLGKKNKVVTFLKKLFRFKKLYRK